MNWITEAELSLLDWQFIINLEMTVKITAVWEVTSYSLAYG
jgi:hypothetical protein